MKTPFLTLAILLSSALQLIGQEITLIDENLNNDWALFRDRIIGSTDEAIYFRMNPSTDSNLYYSDGTNANTTTTGYSFNDGFPTADIYYQSQSGGSIAFGIRGTSNDVLLFENNSAQYKEVAMGLEDLDGVALLNDELYYIASTSATRSNTIFKYDATNQSSSALLEFDNNGVFAISQFKDSLVVIGDLAGSVQLLMVDPANGGFKSVFTFATSPQFPKAINMTNSGDKLYFWFQNGSSVYSLFVTDGTTAGTLAVINDLEEDDEFSYISRKIISGANGELIFQGRGAADNDLLGALYFSDGTIAGSKRINFGSDLDTEPQDFIYQNGLYYFTALFDDESRLMSTDGTESNTKVLEDRYASGLIEYNSKLFTNSDFSGIGEELAFWNQASGKLELAYDIYSGFSDGSPRGFVTTKDKLFFLGLTDVFTRTLIVYTEPIPADNDEDGFNDLVDCNDENPAINPGADEIAYNGEDDDCNPLTLDDDLDEDGYALADDCDDTNANINPGADEIPDNNIDEDCNGTDLSPVIELGQLRINIFPNPVNQYLQLEGFAENDFLSCQLFDLNGKNVIANQYESRLDVREIPSGMYLLNILDLKTGANAAVKILVEH